MQLQPLNLTDTSTKLRVYNCFQRRVQIIFQTGSISYMEILMDFRLYSCLTSRPRNRNRL